MNLQEGYGEPSLTLTCPNRWSSLTQTLRRTPPAVRLECDDLQALPRPRETSRGRASAPGHSYERLERPPLTTLHHSAEPAFWTTHHHAKARCHLPSSHVSPVPRPVDSFPGRAMHMQRAMKPPSFDELALHRIAAATDRSLGSVSYRPSVLLFFPRSPSPASLSTYILNMLRKSSIRLVFSHVVDLLLRAKNESCHHAHERTHRVGLPLASV